MQISEIRWQIVREIFEYLYPLGKTPSGKKFTQEQQEVLWAEMKEVAPNINEAGDHPTCSLGFSERRWNWTMEDIVVTAKLKEMAMMQLDAKANNCDVIWDKFMFGGGMITREPLYTLGFKSKRLMEEYVKAGTWKTY